MTDYKNHWNIQYEGNTARAILDTDALIRDMVRLEEDAIREGIIRELRRQGYVVVAPEVEK